MHEMSLAEGIRSIVEDACLAQDVRRVATVVLEIGELAAVEVDALRFCLDAVLQGSVAEGAEVEVHTIPGRGQCPSCGLEAALHQRHDPCSGCGAYGLRPVAGVDMRVKELEVA